jgi:hypothetical protein
MREGYCESSNSSCRNSADVVTRGTLVLAGKTGSSQSGTSQAQDTSDTCAVHRPVLPLLVSCTSGTPLYLGLGHTMWQRQPNRRQPSEAGREGDAETGRAGRAARAHEVEFVLHVCPLSICVCDLDRHQRLTTALQPSRTHVTVAASALLGHPFVIAAGNIGLVGDEAAPPLLVTKVHLLYRPFVTLPLQQVLPLLPHGGGRGRGPLQLCGVHHQPWPWRIPAAWCH